MKRSGGGAFNFLFSGCWTFVNLLLFYSSVSFTILRARWFLRIKLCSYSENFLIINKIPGTSPDLSYLPHSKLYFRFVCILLCRGRTTTTSVLPIGSNPDDRQPVRDRGRDVDTASIHG